MALPSFEDIMLPMLKFLSDGNEKTYADVRQHLSDHFQLSQEDRRLEKPSGGNYFHNKIAWAKSYLTRANLLEKKRAFKISTQGLDVLAQNHTRITRKMLSNIDEFVQHMPKSKKKTVPDVEKTPDDLIDEGISEINNMLNIDLLDKLKTIEPALFERLVVNLVEKLGYGKGKPVGRSGDGGIDGEISQDRLGLDKIYLQAKRYAGNNVSSHDVRDFLGALTLKRAQKGIFITTSDFSREAYADIERSELSIVLINGEKLVTYMIEHNIGVKIKKSLAIKEISEEYFEELEN